MAGPLDPRRDPRPPAISLAPHRGDTRALEASYPALAASVGDARSAVTTWLRALLADEAMIGDIGLAVSEACTNVVMHAYRGADSGNEASTGCFRVATDRVDDTVRVVVTDDGCGMSPRVDSPGLGLGVPLILALCDTVEVRTAPAGTGTVVSMLFNSCSERRPVLRDVVASVHVDKLAGLSARRSD